jgi:protein involved in polysaccharide export with SLBB domain
MKENETVSDLINLSGGLSSNAFKSAVFIERFDDFSKSVFEVDSNDFSNSVFVDGDKVSFKEIKEENISGVVKIGGAVNLEGNFQLDNNKNVKELINSAKGFSKDKLGLNAVLYRNKNGLDNQSVSLNIEKNSDLLTTLQENDSLYIPSTKDILFDQFIEIKGEVNFPKEIDFRYGLTITDLIIFSGGLTPYANKKDIRIFRNTSTKGDDEVTEEIIIELDDNLIPNQNIILQPDDIVTVNTYPYRMENKFYQIKGEVALPGLYSIKRKNYSVYDAIKENIEFLNSASVDGISILRDSIRIPVFGNKLISQGSNSKYNFELVSGDEINIPANDQTATIIGEVQQEGVLNIDRPINARIAINNVGGFNNNASRKEVYVEYQNGLRKATRSFLFFKFYPKVLPGSKVVVPIKNLDRQKTSVGEIVGYTTSLVSIIALIKSL